MKYPTYSIYLFLFCFTSNLLIALAPQAENIDINTMSPLEFKNYVHESNSSVNKYALLEEDKAITRAAPKKNALFLVYIAADNDLDSFAWYNLQQMAAVGSTAQVNIVVQLNVPGNDTLTERYLVTKNNLVNAAGYTATEKLNSGDPQTLVDFVLWATANYPSDNIYLTLWDHGSGILDPVFARSLNRDAFYVLNPHTNMLELNRNLTFTDHIANYAYTQVTQRAIHYTLQERGVCFDDTFVSYINHDGLEYALSQITQALGKKLDIIGFDACFMAALELTTVCKNYAKYMAASEEVEPGTGWNYQDLLTIFTKTTPPTVVNVAKEITTSYAKTYKTLTTDYTFSTIDLTKTAAIETALNNVATLLLQGLNNQRSNSVLQAITTAMYATTYFYEPTYIDLNHFLMNLLSRISQMTLMNNSQTTSYRNSLKSAINATLTAIKNAVIANAAGANFKNAKGISIYYPYTSIDNSYPSTKFAELNNWMPFITKYLALTT